MNRDQMIATLELMGWTPLRRQAGDMGQLVHFGVKAPDDSGGYSQNTYGMVGERRCGFIMGNARGTWHPCRWDEMRTGALHALFLQVYNHER